MSASTAEIKAFLEAAAEVVAQEIKDLRREAERERELRDAQFAARVAELDVRIASVSNLEQRLATRLDNLRDGTDGTSVTADDVAPMIDEKVRAAVAAIPAPKDGLDGTSVTVDDVAPMIDEKVRAAVAAIPAPKDGLDGTSVTVDDVAPMIDEKVRAAVAAIPAPKDGLDGTSVTVDDVAPLIDEKVRAAVAAIPAPKDGLDGTSVTVDDVAPLIEEQVKAAVAAIPAPKDGLDGTSVTVEDVAPLIDEKVRAAVAAIPAPRDGLDGTSVTVDDVAPLIDEKVRAAVAVIPAPKDGTDGTSVTVDDVAPLIDEKVRAAVAAIPAPKDGLDGTSVTVEDVAPLIDEKVRAAVAAIPAPKDGERGFGLDDFDTEVIDDGQTLLLKFSRGDVVEKHEIPLPRGQKGDAGPMGALPVVSDWSDRVHYEGAVVAFDGGIFQAARDTGKAPGHEDWRCVVRAGRDGADGKSFTIRGTWLPDASYAALDVVSLNGASFAARCDEPGVCPGDGWQLIAKQGKPGQSIKGDKGDKGDTMIASLRSASISGEGLLKLENADGSIVTCDLYDVLAKVGG